MKQVLGFYYTDEKKINIYILKIKKVFFIEGTDKWFLTYAALLDYCENNFKNFKLEEEI